jgi:hypothetical protein
MKRTNQATGLKPYERGKLTSVHFFINCEKGIFSGVDTRSPLWVLIDLYGNSTALEIIDTFQVGYHEPLFKILFWSINFSDIMYAV